MADDSDLQYGGDSPGPETLGRPTSVEQAQKQQRIRLYHARVLYGLPIQFVPKDQVLANRPLRLPTKEDVRRQIDRVQALIMD